MHNVLDDRYRTAIAKLRTSSHVLEIERGRHAKPKIATHLRTCTVCHMIEDEEQFVTVCEINESERKALHRKIENIYPLFKNMNERQMFLYIMSNKDRQVQNGLTNSYTTHSSQGIIESYWTWSNMYHCVYGLFMPLVVLP